MVELAGAQPVALVVRGEDVGIASVGKAAVGRAHSTAHALQFAAVGRDLHSPSPIWRVPARLPVRRVAIECDEEISARIQCRSVGEIVHVAIEAPVRVHAFVEISLTIPICVDEPGQLRLLRDVNDAIDHLQTERLVQTAGEALPRQVRRRTAEVPCEIHLAGPGADREVAIGHPVHASHQQFQLARHGNLLALKKSIALAASVRGLTCKYRR